MLEFLKKLLNLKNGNGTTPPPQEAGSVLRAIVHSDALTNIVKTTGTPVDDLILQIVRSLVPKDAV
jgi:hypothetical protein